MQEIDCGTASNGTLLIIINYDSDKINDIDCWTSSVSDFGSDTTQHSSDGVAIKVPITSDVDTLRAWVAGTGGGSQTYGSMAVANNSISDFGTSDISIAVTLRGLRRYLSVQYTGAGTTTDWTVTFIGDGDEALSPFPGVKTAY